MKAMTHLATFLKAIPVSVVVMPFAWITPACLNHLSDWLSLMLDPSADLSPNWENRRNWALSCALSKKNYDWNFSSTVCFFTKLPGTGTGLFSAAFTVSSFFVFSSASFMSSFWWSKHSKTKTKKQKFWQYLKK